MLDVMMIDDIHLFKDKLREREDFYNYSRPRVDMDGRTPYERFLEKAMLGSKRPD